MDVRNCRKCGKIFNYAVGPIICPKCKEENESKFQIVKEYIQANKSARLADICKDCEVADFTVRQWIREERLFFDSDSPIGVECEMCGTMIKSGRYCEKCKNDLARGLSSAAKKPEEEKKDDNSQRRSNDSKMRFVR